MATYPAQPIRRSKLLTTLIVFDGVLSLSSLVREAHLHQVHIWQTFVAILLIISLLSIWNFKRWGGYLLFFALGTGLIYGGYSAYAASPDLPWQLRATAVAFVFAVGALHLGLWVLALRGCWRHFTSMATTISKPPLIFLGLTIILAGGFAILAEKHTAPIRSSTKPPSMTDYFVPPAEWKTYQNSVFGFEIRYPPNNFLLVNDPDGKMNPAFLDERYQRTWESPALSIDYGPLTFEAFTSLGKAPRFQAGNGHTIVLTDESGKVLRNSHDQILYATCTPYSDQPEAVIINLCNQIISTLKITK